jgi:hypothetical protein
VTLADNGSSVHLFAIHLLLFALATVSVPDVPLNLPKPLPIAGLPPLTPACWTSPTRSGLVRPIVKCRSSKTIWELEKKTFYVQEGTAG